MLPQIARNLATKEKYRLPCKRGQEYRIQFFIAVIGLIWHIIPEDKYPRTKNGKFPEQWQYIFDSIETLAFVTIKTTKIALSTAKSKGNNSNLIRL